MNHLRLLTESNVEVRGSKEIIASNLIVAANSSVFGDFDFDVVLWNEPLFHIVLVSCIESSRRNLENTTLLLTMT